MDGIGLELWNKKLLQCRYKRQLEFRACAELSLTNRAYAIEPLPSVLFRAAAENLDLLVLHWKETFLGSWQRQKPDQPAPAAGQARGEIETILTTEQKQIENEVQALGISRNLGWKPEEFQEGKTHLASEVSLLRAGCVTQIADARSSREQELETERARRAAHHRELIQTRVIGAGLIVLTALSCTWLGAQIDINRSKADRLFVDERISHLMDGQRRTQEQLSNLHQSNRKIAFWTEKTPAQIDKEIEDTRESLNTQIADIKAEIDRKSARVESEYARSGRDGGEELEMRKQSLLRLQEKTIAEARQKTEKKIFDLEEQKRNIQR